MSHNSSFSRSPQSPVINHQQLHHKNSAPRRPSIVEMLSSPPPLPVESQAFPPDDFSLSRNTSISSRSSSVLNATGNAEWSDIPLVDLVETSKLIAINSSYSVQKAFETLVDHDLTSLPVALSRTNFDLTNCLSFDYSDLNTYLLLVMNKINLNDLIDEYPNEVLGKSLTPQQKHDNLLAIVAKAKKGEDVPVDAIIRLHPKNPLIMLKETQPLIKAVEAFGNGVHRVAILNSENRISGILSQRRVLKFFWENARRFPSLEFYLNSSLHDLKIGSTSPLTIYGDQPLIEALQKMFDERVSSLAVIDRNKCLVGNISIVDVKNVSSTKNSHYLFKPVTNFISYNLSQKGIERGQDQFPIFHVNSSSSLARVIAKLVATQSHRLWIVESGAGSISSMSSGSTSTVENALSESISQESGRPGTLVGVITLTDILGLFAHQKSGVKIDPLTARNNRRRSSTSTTRSSIDSATLNVPVSAPSSAPTTPGVTNSANASQPNQDLFRKSYKNTEKINEFN